MLYLQIIIAVDAIRIADGDAVAIKMRKMSVHPYEVDTTKFHSSEPLASDPRNHCIAVIDVLQSPFDSDREFLVLPQFIQYHDVPFATVGEALAFF